MALALSGSASAAARALARQLVAPTTRGYAAAASSGAMRRAADGTGGEVKERSAAAAGAEVSSWVPDPVTGHYRPSNWAADALDAADLRAAHLGRSYARA